MNLDESVTSNECCCGYLPEPRPRSSSRARYKVEQSHHRPTNLLRHHDSSRYTIQSQRLGQNVYLESVLARPIREIVLFCEKIVSGIWALFRGEPGTVH